MFPEHITSALQALPDVYHITSADVVINAAPPAPNAPIVVTVTQPSLCADPTGSVVLNGLPETGTWTINPGAITGTGTSTTITNLVPGTYNFSVTSAAGCISLPSTDVIIISPPGTPAAPITGTITQPSSCSVPTGSVVLNGLPASGTWTINPGGITGTGTTTTISGLIPGTYNFTVTIASGCTSLQSSAVVINESSGIPAAPAIGTITQPSSCSDPTGSVVLSGLPATGTWTINPGSVAGTGTNTTISGLAVGTYSFTVTDANGCTSQPSENVVIVQTNVAPESPVQTTDCSLGSGNSVITVISPTGAGLEYSFDGGQYQNETTFIGVANGTHTITVRNSSGCTSTVTSFRVSCGCPLSMTVTSSVSNDGAYNINCAGDKTGSIDVMATDYTGSVNYLWIDGYIGSSRTNLSAGKYKVIITDSNNCQADSVITLTEPEKIKMSFNITEPFCPEKPDGDIRVNVTGGISNADYTYKWSDFSASNYISNIPSGFYKVTVTDNNGCSAADSLWLNSLNKTCLIIPEAFSPNGDLINDLWIIGNTDLYPKMEIIIYNRWGQSVWKSEIGYPVPWDGRSEGVNLPVDSYHYVIDLHNGLRPVVGSVTIIR